MESKRSSLYYLPEVLIGFTIGFIIYVIYSVINGTFILLPSTLSMVTNSIPPSSHYFVDLLQGLLTFSSITFGFFAVILIEILPHMVEFTHEIMSRNVHYYKKVYYLLVAVTVVLLLIAPIFLLTISISNSLIAMGTQGVLLGVIQNKTQNSTNSNYQGTVTVLSSQIKSSTTTATNETFISEALILVNILVYITLLTLKYRRDKRI